jgi:hypothetical protein
MGVFLGQLGHVWVMVFWGDDPTKEPANAGVQEGFGSIGSWMYNFKMSIIYGKTHITPNSWRDFSRVTK